MKIKVIRARNKKLAGKIIDIGEDIAHINNSGMWSNVKTYRNVNYNNGVYRANVYTPTQRMLVDEPDAKARISLYPEGAKHGSTTDIWEFEVVN